MNNFSPREGGSMLSKLGEVVLILSPSLILTLF